MVVAEAVAVIDKRPVIVTVSGVTVTVTVAVTVTETLTVTVTVVGGSAEERNTYIMLQFKTVKQVLQQQILFDFTSK